MPCLPMTWECYQQWHRFICSSGRARRGDGKARRAAVGARGRNRGGHKATDEGNLDRTTVDKPESLILTLPNPKARRTRKQA